MATRRGHVCPNAYHDEGANGGCYFEIRPATAPGAAHLDVGWSCVTVHDAEIPVSWLSELIAIATDHKGGIVGFLKDHSYGGSESYALMVDPPRVASPRSPDEYP